MIRLFDLPGDHVTRLIFLPVAFECAPGCCELLGTGRMLDA